MSWARTSSRTMLIARRNTLFWKRSTTSSKASRYCRASKRSRMSSSIGSGLARRVRCNEANARLFTASLLYTAPKPSGFQKNIDFRQGVRRPTEILETISLQRKSQEMKAQVMRARKEAKPLTQQSRRKDYAKPDSNPRRGRCRAPDPYRCRHHEPYHPYCRHRHRIRQAAEILRAPPQGTPGRHREGRRIAAAAAGVCRRRPEGPSPLPAAGTGLVVCRLGHPGGLVWHQSARGREILVAGVHPHRRRPRLLDLLLRRRQACRRGNCKAGS